MPLRRCQPLMRSSPTASRTGMRASSRSSTSARYAPSSPVTRPRLGEQPGERRGSRGSRPGATTAPTTTTALAATSTATSHPVILRRWRATGMWPARAMATRACHRLARDGEDCARSSRRCCAPRRSSGCCSPGQVLSLIGDRVMLVALPFAVLEAGGSIEAVGLVVAAQLVPFLVFALAGGVISDRGDRRRVLIASDVARLVVQARRRRAARGRRRQPAHARACWPRSTGRPTPSSSRRSPACCRRPCRTPASCSRPTRCAG